MTEGRKLDIHAWYPARLRRMSSLSNGSSNLTPVSLVESDRKLIQSFVEDASKNQGVRTAEMLAKIRSRRPFLDNADCLLFAITFLGTLLLILSSRI